MLSVRPKHFAALLAAVALLWECRVGAAAGVTSGYSNYRALETRLEKVASGSDAADLRSLGTTLGGRKVWLLTLSQGKPESKPAILVVGGIDLGQIHESELALRVAERLARPENRKLLERVTVYVVPRLNPDGCETLFGSPLAERETNERPADDDRDFELNEDGPEDLNGDGLITQMRVADAGGDLMPHPTDPRVLIKADPAKHERGRYKIYVEGIDNDQDEQFGEDGPGGVAPNRNFSFDYAFFQPGAGPHQVSEVETRALADFAFSRPNVSLVLALCLDDNLFHPWKPNAEAGKQRIKTSVLEKDAPYFDYLAEQYRKEYGPGDAPDAKRVKGSLLDWAYFHYGRWALGTRGWYIPPAAAVDKPDKADKEKADKKEKPAKGQEKPKDKPDERGRTDLDALAWFKTQNIDGFVPWKVVKHPDFPGKTVEVGGFKPLVRITPPASELDGLADRHVRYMATLVDLLPKITLDEVTVEDLGGGLCRVKVRVANAGYLPTMSEMGRSSRRMQGLQLEIELPRRARTLGAPARARLEPLEGDQTAKHSWLVQLEPGGTRSAAVRVWSPSVGADRKTIELGAKQ